MFSSTKTTPEEKRAAEQKKARNSLELKEKERQERARHTAKLRSLRLAKEAADAAVTASDAESSGKRRRRS